MLLDTSAWVDFFKKTKRSQALIPLMQEEVLYTSEISLAELSDWCFKNGLESAPFFAVVKRHSSVLKLPEAFFEGIGAFYNTQRNKKPKFGMMDALIAATALAHGLHIVTFDQDFQGLKDAIVLR